MNGPGWDMGPGNSSARFQETFGVRPSFRNVPHTYRQSFENGDLHVASRGRLFFREVALYK